MPPLLAQRVRDAIYPRSAAVTDAAAFTARTVTGSPFTGNTADRVACPVAINGYFNWRNVAIARAVCSEGDVIVEVGANIGSETVSFSDIVGATGAVYAFEPYPPNVELLRINVSATASPNVDVYPIALSDRLSTARFVVPSAQNSGFGHLLGGEEQAREQGTLVEVECRTLDSLLDQLRTPQLIAIDAEGHESLILEGAQRMLASGPVLVLEVLAELLGRTGSSPARVAEQLRSFDYQLFEIRRFGLAPLPLSASELPHASDWLAVSSSSAGMIERVRHTLARAGLMPCVRGFNPLVGR